MRDKGALGLFSGLNIVAFILVFLLVEETKMLSLEDLDLIYAVPKRKFMRYQIKTYLPWFVRRFILRKKVELKSLYIDRACTPDQANAPGGLHGEPEAPGILQPQDSDGNNTLTDTGSIHA